MSDSNQTLFRSPKDKEPYKAFSRAMFEDDRISFEAKGVLGYLLVKPDNWKTNIEDLKRRGKIGTEKAYRIINELIQFGYCERFVIRNELGQVTGTEYHLHESPLPEKPDTAKQETVKPDTVQPDTEKQHHTNKEVLLNKNNSNTDQSKTINKAEPIAASGASINKNNKPGGKPKYNSPQQNSLADFVAFGEKYGIDRPSLIAMKDAVLEVTGDMELSMSGSNAGERALDIAQDTVKTLIVHNITTPQMVLNLLPVWRARHYTSKDRETGKKGDRAVPHTSGLTDVAKDIKTGAYGWDTTPAKPAFKPERFEYRGYMVETINEEGDFIDPDAPHIINARKGGMKYFDMEMFNRNLEKESE